jgi:hypothetical protein
VPLLLGIAGMPGSGKTFSAHRLARGMVSVLGGHVHGLDTETNRMLHYAHTAECSANCKNPGHFDFIHTPFLPPYDAFSYLEGIRHGLDNGATVTIVDSASDMHEGIGGMLDQQVRFLDEKAGNDWTKRKQLNAASWNHVKDPLKRALLAMLQLNTVLIFCFRARDKSDWGATDERGKTVVASLGSMAIADDHLIYSMTAQALLEPGAEGKPTWDPPLKGEKVQTKRGPFKELIAGLSGPMNEEMGAIMARWALGDDAPKPATTQRKADPAPASPAGGKAPQSIQAADVRQRVQAAATLAEIDALSNEVRNNGWTAEEKQAVREAFARRRKDLTA